MDQVDLILQQWHKEKPGLDVNPMGTIGRLGRLAALLTSSMEQVHQKHGLNFSSFDVLATLKRSGPPYALSPSDLIYWTMVTSGTMTNRLDRLEKSGLIERKRNPDDGRGFVVVLTEKGHDVINAAVSDHVENQHKLLDCFDSSELENLNALLRKWYQSMNDGK